MTKEILTIPYMVLNAEEIGNALQISKENIIKEFKDGRVSSRFSEYWASKIFGLIKHMNSNAPGSDALKELSHFLGSYKTSYKSLSSAGIKFQKSIHTGGKRHCTQQDVIDAIESVDAYIAIDIVSFPKVKFILLKSNTLMRWATTPNPRGKRLPDGQRVPYVSPNGLSFNNFYTLIDEKYRRHEVQVKLEN